MKLSKSHLQQTLRSLVAATTVKAGTKLIKELAVVKTSVGKVLQYEANLALLELSEARQVELIQKRILSSASTGNYAVYSPSTRKDSWDSKEFSRLSWSVMGVPQTERENRQKFFREVIAGWSGSGLSSIFGIYSESLGMYGGFPAIADVGAASCIYPLTHEKWSEGYNSDLLKLHKASQAICEKIKALLFQASDMLNDVTQATLTCTTLEKLLELLPEAQKHLPAEVTLAKPTKQVADPKIINDIRAKLAAGLPV